MYNEYKNYLWVSELDNNNNFPFGTSNSNARNSSQFHMTVNLAPHEKSKLQSELIPNLHKTWVMEYEPSMVRRGYMRSNTLRMTISPPQGSYQYPFSTPQPQFNPLSNIQKWWKTGMDCKTLFRVFHHAVFLSIHAI